MAKVRKKPFNLLVRSSLQLDKVDRIYEFVMGPGRIIVVLVMFTIVMAFVYRFPLDYKLNDQKEAAKLLARQLSQQYPQETQEKFISINAKSESLKKYINLYKDTNRSNRTSDGLDTEEGIIYKIHQVIPEVKTIVDKYKPDILVSSYNLSATEDGVFSISISGVTLRFSEVDNLKNDLSSLEYVSDVIASSISAEQGSTPQFSINIILK